MLLYSRMAEECALLFIYTMLIFLIFSQTVSLINLVRVNKKIYRESQEADTKDIILSKMVFGSPNFGI